MPSGHVLRRRIVPQALRDKFWSSGGFREATDTCISKVKMPRHAKTASNRRVPAADRTSFLRPCPGNGLSSTTSSPASASKATSRFTALRSRPRHSAISVMERGFSRTTRMMASRAAVSTCRRSAGSSKLIVFSSVTSFPASAKRAILFPLLKNIFSSETCSNIVITSSKPSNPPRNLLRSPRNSQNRQDADHPNSGGDGIHADCRSPPLDHDLRRIAHD